MKNIVKMIGLFALIGFSFFYTDKVIEVIRQEDEIMIQLNNIEETYKTLPINANILGNTIIPGLSGKSINIEESYKKMKTTGIFNKNLIIYDNIAPDISIKNNKDKFIIKGNNSKQMISIIFILENDLYFDKINEIFNLKQEVANYFVDYSYLINNSTKIKETKNHEFYSYGNNGQYTLDNLLFSNNLLSRIKNLEAIYCLTENMDEKILNLCSSNNLYTIVPTIIGDKNPYTDLKDNLSSGAIILLKTNQEILTELPTIINYIKGKGLNITGLSDLLSEELTEY